MPPSRIILALSVALTLSNGSTFAAKSRADAGDAGPAKPALPTIVSLKLEPASLTLSNSRDGRRVLVWGIAEDGHQFDLTDVATFKADSPNLSLDKQNYVYPVAAGDCTLTVSALTKQATLPVKVTSADDSKIRFIRDVEPILSQVGCNAGTCHGSAKGKNGFKLSLRGYDPVYDYAVLVQELQGRRVNRVQPDMSLMLLKPTGAVPHEGRRAFSSGVAPLQRDLSVDQRGGEF